MTLTCIYHMIQTGETFNPSDIKDFSWPSSKKQALTDETAIAFLVAQGYDVSGLNKFVKTNDSPVIESLLIDTA